MKIYLLILLFPLASYAQSTIECEVSGLFSNEATQLEFLVDGQYSSLTQSDENRSETISCFENPGKIDEFDPDYKSDYVDALILTCNDERDELDFVFNAGSNQENKFDAMLLGDDGVHYYSFDNCVYGAF